MEEPTKNGLETNKNNQHIRLLTVGFIHVTRVVRFDDVSNPTNDYWVDSAHFPNATPREIDRVRPV